jgi:hypothetical protein
MEPNGHRRLSADIAEIGAERRRAAGRGAALGLAVEINPGPHELQRSVQPSGYLDRWI